MMNLDKIQHKLNRYSPRKIPGRRWMVRSSVAALITNEDKPSIILIRRPVKQGDPWSGHMCFPGGRQSRQDKNSYATALRETYEEVGINLDTNGVYLGRLSDVMTRAHEGMKPMIVTPWVFLIESEKQLQLSDEAREIVSIPLSYFLEANNRQTMQWRVGPVNYHLPCYLYRGARVWGLTLLMLDELMRISGGKISFADNWLRLLRLRK